MRLTPSSCYISVNAFCSGIQLTHRLDLVLKLLHDVRGAHDLDTRSETEDPAEELVAQGNVEAGRNRPYSPISV